MVKIGSPRNQIGDGTEVRKPRPNEKHIMVEKRSEATTVNAPMPSSRMIAPLVFKSKGSFRTMAEKLGTEINLMGGPLQSTKKVYKKADDIRLFKYRGYPRKLIKKKMW